jgi:3-oxocholest-4-en-26-oyl-CoA dehydrogenase alpha subunit
LDKATEAVRVNWDYSPEDDEWRAEVRNFLEANLDGEIRAENHDINFSTGPRTKRLIRTIAEAGWNSLTWPTEYGGENLGAVRKLIMIDEWTYAKAPEITYVDLTNDSIAPIIIEYGTEENKADWLEPIRRGDVVFALGYSEPQAGTDLASLSTRAYLDGDVWVINGQKIWNSAAHVATHEWLAVRTGTAEDRHRGISIIVVPIDAPGVEIQPIKTWPNNRTNQTFFTDVRVPYRNLIGKVNGGWEYISHALRFERISLGGALGRVRRLLDDLEEYVQATELDGTRLADRPAVRQAIGKFEARVEAAQLMALDIAVRTDKGDSVAAEGTALKVVSSELRRDLATWGMNVAGMVGQLDLNDFGAPLGGALEKEYRANPIAIFGGGTNDVMREIIAQTGLGLPRGIRRPR